MRAPHLRLAALSAAILGCIPLGAHAQLEEIIVTATRRETSLQDTPLSIQAFTSQQLELGGITNGRDLGIMVPNVVLNPSTGGGQANFYIRGLPGVGLYVDGVWQDGFGFQQMNFTEMERIEVLRGPQGTLFGRNTNGGAVNMTTKKPADEFGARVRLDVGDFNRRDAQLAVDLPITDKLKTKFIGAALKNDGFIKGVVVPYDFGSQDDTLMRADILWEATDNFSLRYTHNDERKRGTDPKIHRMTRYENAKIYAYNIMLGAFQAAANARCSQLNNVVAVPAGTPTAYQGAFSCTNGVWSAPPKDFGQVGARFTNKPISAFNYTTHMTGYEGGLSSHYGTYTGGNFLTGTYTPNPYVADQTFGPSSLGKWSTRSDSMQDGITADLKYDTLHANWNINDKLQFEAILASWRQAQRQVIDFDGTEFLVTTDDIVQRRKNSSAELHLSGKALHDRINWLGGYYKLNEDLKQRFYRWGMWEFGIPTAGPGKPAVNVEYSEYVRQTAFLLNLNGLLTSLPGAPVVNSGGNLQTTSGNLYPWNLRVISDDALTKSYDSDDAFFGEATFSVTDKLDLTVGARISDRTGGSYRYDPSDAFRTLDPSIRPNGDPFAYSVVTLDQPDPRQPKIHTYKFAAQYQFTPDIMGYVSYGEGFTSASSPLITIGTLSVVPNGCDPRINADQVICHYKPEIISTNEIGLRSDLANGKLRFNATYFDSTWNNMRVTLLPFDANGNTQPYPYQSGDGAGTAKGWEFEVVWAATERLRLNVGLGLIDTNYIQAGFFDGFTGNYPGAPFAYAADTSGTIGVQYQIPLSGGGQIMLIGDYGYMGPYARDAAYQRTQIDPATGKPKLEPGYGILNARFVYQPAKRNYSLELWGKNLTDELYVNGGFDTRDTWGYDFSIVGRSREVGATLSFTF
jgi:outer membrane receptor protein involved in Fe transport